MKKIFSFVAAMLLCLPMMQGAIKVHTIGDSTMAEYDESTTDKRGSVVSTQELLIGLRSKAR